MRKIAALVEHLLAASGLPHEQCHAFADQGQLLLTGSDMGPVFQPDVSGVPVARRQLELGQWKYEAVINLERYPYDGPTLLALILAWLARNDPDRREQDLKDPELTVTLNDAETADVEISIDFEEALAVVEDAAGPIVFEDRRWSVAPVVVTPAEELAAMHGAVKGDDHV